MLTKSGHQRSESLLFSAIRKRISTVTIPKKYLQRFCLLFLAFFVQSLYFPLNRLTTSGVTVELPIDAYIPLWPVLIVPYLITLPLWIISTIWATLRMEDGLYKATVAGMLLALTTGILCFIYYPTYVERPGIPGNDIFSTILTWLYGNDRVFNALPSGHVYITFALALFYALWYPSYRWLWFGLTIVIALSTLFTKQHVIADTLAGVLVGWIGYRFGLWWHDPRLHEE